MSSATTTCGMQVFNKSEKQNKRMESLWSHALQTTRKAKVGYNKVQQIGGSICKTSGWMDPVDSLCVYACIAKTQASDAIVEDEKER